MGLCSIANFTLFILLISPKAKVITKRYDPSSSVWIEILEETEAKPKKVIENKQAKEEAKKKNKTKKDNKKASVAKKVKKK